MKILKLNALNINSLKGKTKIDFTTFLNNNALFAITGPTGAGKSTILDIITCALYGRTPRLKNPNELMARHTGECYCEVEFEIRGEIYRSSWTQKRARKSGTGKFQTAKMEISSVSDEKVIKSTLREVPKYIEELSGLDFDRFIQSMMLAQGSFDAFLKAKEADRSNLLEKITGTQIYAKISKEIYDRYIEHKNEIESDKKILENTSLLDTQEVKEKDILLQKYIEEKNIFDIKEKELLSFQVWLESFAKLTLSSIEYENLYNTISKKKESKKEDFEKLDLAMKALNVQVIYDNKNSLEKEINKDTQTIEILNSNIEKLKSEIKITQDEYEKAQEKTLQEKKEFDLNSTKIKELRVFETQIQEQEKQLVQIHQEIASQTEERINYQKKIEESKTKYATILQDITNYTEYLTKNKKDNSLVSSIVLIKNSLDEYELEKQITIKREVEQKNLFEKSSFLESSHKQISDTLDELKKSLDLKNSDYQKIDELSILDNKNEEINREKLSTYKMLLKEHSDYTVLLNTIEKEEQLKSLNVQESKHLSQSILNKELLITEFSTHLETLKKQRENELLIVKYETDREKLKEGDECFLCGSTSHPFIINNDSVDIDTTNSIIEEKENILKTNENELQSIKKKQIQIETKLEAIQLELIKQNEFLEEKKNIFKKHSLILDEQCQKNLEEQIIFFQKSLEEILLRREEKEKLLKEKELASQSYTLKNTEFLKSQKELDEILLNQKQNKKDEDKSAQKFTSLTTYLSNEFQKYDVLFDEVNYKSVFEELNTREELFSSTKIKLGNKEFEKNTFDLTNKENEIQLNKCLIDLTKNEESLVLLQSSILSLKEESLEILNIADINIFELQIKNSFEKIQKYEINLKEELTRLETKNHEYQKQQQSLNQEIEKNTNDLKILEVKFLDTLQNHDFKDEITFKNALLETNEREVLEISCKQIEHDFVKYQTLKTDTFHKLEIHKKENKTKKTSQEIEIELLDLKQKSDTVQKEIGALSEVLKRDAQDREKHQKKINELESKKENFEVWIKLYEMIGSADGSKFAKFAQGITLDQLILLANNHLSVLSNRYELQRSQEQKQLLEIKVCDSFQGDVIRPVSTLSGGESFIVSLSLALGLSELASQQISIDSLFLDEGFGTLDEDSLETALNALNLLQSSGKMVGVISHVEALKERIPLQIKITPKGDGTSSIILD